MEYSLVRKQDIKFGNVVTKDDDEDTKYSERVARVPVEIYRKTSDSLQLGSVYERPIPRFREDTRPLRNTGFKKLRLHDQSWSLDVAVYHNTIGGGGLIKITSGNDSEEEECCLSRLAAICGGLNRFSVDMDIEIGDEPQNPKILRRHLKLRHLKGIKKIGFCTIYTGFESLSNSWVEDSFVAGNLRMDLKPTDDAFDNLLKTNLQNPLSINRKLLSYSTLSDAVIRVKNGVDCEEVRCHKGFLSAHSPVFKAMFESSSKEGLTGTVDITDMTVQGVRALLAYLYCWELEDAANSCSIAVELLQSGNKYLIPRLVSSIQTLILSKENTWFTAGVAAQLLQLAKNKREEGDETYKDVETKAIAILKSKSTLELKECMELQKLLQDPNMAMDFCIYLIHTEK